MTKLDTATINKLIGVDDIFKAPSTLMKRLLNKPDREKMFDAFLNINKDVSYDWFTNYFQDEAAQRKKEKQDFTPKSISNLVNQMIFDSTNDNYYEPAAGTGGMAIEHWWQECLKQSPFSYKPHEHFMVLEERSERAIPFLLFNLSIRGINAAVNQCDSLDRGSKKYNKGVFFIQNIKDNPIGYSSVNIMPYTDEVKHCLDTEDWDKDYYKPHVEDKFKDWSIYDNAK